MKDQDAIFASKRAHILESLQVSLAYLCRKRKKHRIEMERLEEIRRVEAEKEAKRKARLEKIERQKQ